MLFLRDKVMRLIYTSDADIGEEQIASRYSAGSFTRNCSKKWYFAVCVSEMPTPRNNGTHSWEKNPRMYLSCDEGRDVRGAEFIVQQ